MQYFVGSIMVAVGVLMVLKTEWIVQNFGTNAWAEAKIGTFGGTRIMYKFLGLIIIFFGFLTVTNMLKGFLTVTLLKLFT